MFVSRSVTAFALTLLLSGSVAHAAPSIADLNVHPSDLPSGTRALSSELYTAAQYDALLQIQSGTSAAAGIQQVNIRTFAVGPGQNVTVLAELFQFRSSGTAHTRYVLFSTAAHKGAPGTTFLPMTGIGDESIATSGVSPVGKRTPQATAFLRRGAYVGAVLISGTGKILPASAVIKLARMVDTRIRAAH